MSGVARIPGKRINLTRYRVDGAQGRSLFTVQPLASDLGLEVDTHCQRGEVWCVVNAIHRYKGPGNILISWRHGPMGDIVEALGDGVPIEYPKKR